MKYSIYFLILVTLFFLFSCDEAGKRLKFDSDRPPVMDTLLYSQSTQILFQDTMLDIGTIKEGGEYQIVYKYRNTGNAPLMLFQVSPSCGCTIAEFSHNPLLPGMRDSIIAKFDSKSKSGSYQKNIKVYCNSEQKVHDLYFKVNVVK